MLVPIIFPFGICMGLDTGTSMLNTTWVILKLTCHNYIMISCSLYILSFGRPNHYLTCSSSLETLGSMETFGVDLTLTFSG